MANQRVTDLDPIVTLPDSGIIHVIDTTNNAQNAAGSSFKMTKADFLKENTAAILLNTSKLGVTPAQATAITNNTIKVGYTDALVAAAPTVLANTAKVGITTGQAASITNTEAALNNYVLKTEQTYSVVSNSSVLTIVGFIQKTGTIGTNAGFKRSGFISCYGLTNISLTIKDSSSVGMSFYDKDFVYISGKDGFDFTSPIGFLDRIIAVPTNAYYFITSSADSFAANFFVKKGVFEDVGGRKIADLITDLTIDESFSVIKKSELLTIVGFVQKTGTIGTNTGFKRSTFISCYGLTTLNIPIRASQSAGIAFYNSSFVYISGKDGFDFTSPTGFITRSVAVPSNAYYFIISTKDEDLNKFFVQKGSFNDIGRDPAITPVYNIYDRNLSTYIGAMNTVIDALLVAKPSAKFVFISNFTEDLFNSANANANGRAIIEMQRALARYWNTDFLDLSTKLGLVNRTGANTLVTFVPDYTHPGGDSANGYRVVNLIARECRDFLFPKIDSWSGKRIAWYGTSIPAGFPNTTLTAAQYPKQTAALLGATCDNYAISSSMVRLTKADGSARTSSRPSFTEVGVGNNYINKMVDLIGTANEPDVFVFDHGRNDFVEDGTDFNILEYRKI